jgi:phosphocarrier protein HPr
VEECQIQVTVVNTHGLHARPAMQFVDTANKFISEIIVANGETEMDAKSIMSVMQLAATRGTVLRMKARGQDAEQALAALAELVNKGFGEQ